MDNLVVYESLERIATITLNRPDRLNSWTGRMNFEYRTALARAADDPEIRVIVVTGAGRGFCSGADAEALAGHADRGAYDDGLPDRVPRPGWGVRPEIDAELAYHLGIDKSIIAMVNGPAAGLGFALMCWCDLGFAAAGARLSSTHGRLGLPAEFGLSWLLARIVGLTRAADILLSSRIFTAEEGNEMGLFNAVVPPEELGKLVRDYARAVATAVAPSSLAVTKRQLYRDLLTSDPAGSVRDAEATMTAMMREPEYREGVSALKEKRPPRYR